jgi:hypothetical protein
LRANSKKSQTLSMAAVFTFPTGKSPTLSSQ